MIKNLENLFKISDFEKTQPETEWKQPQAALVSPTTNPAQQPNKKVTLNRAPPVPKWKSESLPSKSSSQAPIDLSLVDDEALNRGLRRGLSTESPEIIGVRKLGSPTESGDADLLYEYFPLSVDDWYVQNSR